MATFAARSSVGSGLRLCETLVDIRVSPKNAKNLQSLAWLGSLLDNMQARTRRGCSRAGVVTPFCLFVLVAETATVRGRDQHTSVPQGRLGSGQWRFATQNNGWAPMPLLQALQGSLGRALRH